MDNNEKLRLMSLQLMGMPGGGTPPVTQAGYDSNQPVLGAQIDRQQPPPEAFLYHAYTPRQPEPEGAAVFRPHRPTDLQTRELFRLLMRPRQPSAQ